MDQLSFSVTPQAFDTILNALAQRPFIEVNDLLGDLLQQANAQRQPPAPEEPPSDPAS